MRTDVLLGLTVAGALALGVVAALLSDPSETATNDFRTSTLVAGPHGSQALHETLAELGIPVQRRRTAFFNLGERFESIGLLAVLAPPAGLLTDELAEVVAFLRSGGAIVVAGNGGGITACAGYEAPRADSGVVWDGAPAELGRSVAVASPRDKGALPPARRVLRPLEEVEEGLERRREQVRLEAGCEGLVPVSTDTVLRARDRRPVMLALTYVGSGRLLLVADPVYFRNRAWRDTPTPYFMIPLIVPERRGPVVWDEYHQGFGAANNGATAAFRDWLRRSPPGWALLQLGAVALVWILVTAVRFGPPLAVIERRRRSPLEHVDALAAGLEGARGTDVAVDLIISGLRRRLSRAGHVGSSDIGGWLGALQLVVPSARGRAAARRLQQLRNEPGGHERVLVAAQAVEDVWQDLRPAKVPARS